MSQNKTVRFGPVALTTTLTTNLLNPGTTTGGVGMPANSVNLFVILKHIRITNVTAGSVTFTLAIGTSAVVASSANSFMGFGVSIPANSYIDWYGLARLDASDFLVGGASANSSLTFEAEGEVGVN